MSTRKLTRLTFSLLAGSVFTWVSTMPAPAQMRQEQAKLTVVVGQVQVLRKGGTTWQPARLGMALSAGDEIRAGQKSGAELAMVDGSVVMILARTRLQIRQLATEAATRSRTSWFHLVVGIVRYVVVKAAVVLVQTRQDMFAISTPTAVVAVRGTDGITSHFPGKGGTNLFCLEGLSSFTALDKNLRPLTGKHVLCTPGQFFSVIKGNVILLKVFSPSILATLRGAELPAMQEILDISPLEFDPTWEAPDIDAWGKLILAEIGPSPADVKLAALQATGVVPITGTVTAGFAPDRGVEPTVNFSDTIPRDFLQVQQFEAPVIEASEFGAAPPGPQ